jgi:hypothetical protein
MCLRSVEFSRYDKPFYTYSRHVRSQLCGISPNETHYYFMSVQSRRIYSWFQPFGRYAWLQYTFGKPSIITWWGECAVCIVTAISKEELMM